MKCDCYEANWDVVDGCELETKKEGRAGFFHGSYFLKHLYKTLPWPLLTQLQNTDSITVDMKYVWKHKWREIALTYVLIILKGVSLGIFFLVNMQ